MYKNKGFTLIELLVVIAIIGILSSVVLANLSGARERARDAERISDIAQMQLALELFYNACRQYPASTSTIAANNCTGTINLGVFMDSIPEGDYEYKTNGVGSNHSNYVIEVRLETSDRVLAGDVDNALLEGVSGLTCADGPSDDRYHYCVSP